MHSRILQRRQRAQDKHGFCERKKKESEREQLKVKKQNKTKSTLL